MKYYRQFARISVALAALVAAHPLLAQEQAPAAEDTASEAESTEIVVTARRREEKLQDVPIAITAITSERLETTGVTSLEGLTQLVPSVSFRKGTTSANSAIVMRGVGTITFSIAAEPSVSTVVDGVVLSRKVEPGQTVAASFQAPILFVLAEDLTTMELQVDVDEADVGQAAVGQKAEFSVDAWPGRRYRAMLTRIGYGANDKDGVISYPGVLAVDNKDLSLRPGMTGTAEITTLTRDNVLLVPNAALRFTPPDPEAAVKKPNNNRGALGMLLPRPPSSARRAPQAQTPTGGEQRLWTLQNGAPVAVPVQLGATDGRHTEVTAGELRAGMEVITEAQPVKP